MSRITCPKCGGRKSKTIDSRPSSGIAGPAKHDEPYIRRRRHCTKCETNWTTYEISDADLREFHRMKTLSAEIYALLSRSEDRKDS